LKHDWPRIPDLPGVATLKASGFWEMFYAAQKNICGMTSYLIWEDTRGQIVVVKRFPDDGGLTVQIFKNNWRWKASAASLLGPKVPLTIEFDRTQVWKVDGRSFDRHLFATGASPGIELTLTAKQSVEFMELLSARDMFWINFSSGTEPRWTIDLRGGREVVSGFRQCVREFMFLDEDEGKIPEEYRR
jgi:hypothetical protein